MAIPNELSAVTQTQIAHCERPIRPYIRRTPSSKPTQADFGLEPERLIFQLELLQHCGSFKVRGAFANLMTLEVPPGGVTAASAGNHGAAVAYGNEAASTGENFRSAHFFSGQDRAHSRVRR